MDDAASDADLVARAQRGDLDAYERLIARHSRRLRAHVALRAPAPHLIDEIAHEALVFAYRRIAEAPGEAFRAWLLAIAGNLLRAEVQRFARERRHRERLAREHREPDPVPAGADGDVLHLERCLDAMPSRMRALIDLKYAEGRDGEDIARRLGRSAAWVASTLFRLRAQLRDCIESRRLAEGRP